MTTKVRNSGERATQASYDLFWYENEIEDPGSVSWIVIDPSHVKLIGRMPPP